ncbi:uncharacterized protein LOC117109032, partial [Anneissia japonica]|uniref:uncharacterized protein LOC117109032 n=1 Tax=Anneissia japonica TaxID=1529436 RepID=UPI00142561AA
MDSEGFVTCPFFRDHRVKWSRFHRHFCKCKARYDGDEEIELCRLGCLTGVEISKMAEHEEICSMRQLYVQPSNSLTRHGSLTLPTYREYREPEEYWDLEWQPE